MYFFGKKKLMAENHEANTTKTNKLRYENTLF